MRYVLDSNVAIKWVLPEADTPKPFGSAMRSGAGCMRSWHRTSIRCPAFAGHFPVPSASETGTLV